VYRLTLTPLSAASNSDTAAAPKLHSLVTAGDGTDQEFAYSVMLIVRAAVPAATAPIVFGARFWAEICTRGVLMDRMIAGLKPANM
jgi:hypothetical protein